MVKKSFLVTGASGLVGKYIVETLSKQYKIYALVRSIPDNFIQDVTYFEADLTSDFFTTCLPKEIDGIIHLAQSNYARDFPLQALDIFNVNVKSTSLLLDYAQKSGATHFIYTSTGGVYGTALEPFKEDMQINISSGELSFYFTSKYIAENLVKSYSELMSVYILRPFFIYGKNQRSSMLLPRLIKNIKNGNPINLQGEKGLLINPVHVSDVVELIRECLLINNGTTINVAGPNIFYLRDIAEILGDFLGKQPIYNQLTGDYNHIVANNDIMKKIIRRPLIEFQKGVVDLI